MFPLHLLPIVLDEENWWYLSSVVHRPPEATSGSDRGDCVSPEILGFEIDPDCWDFMSLYLEGQSILRKTNPGNWTVTLSNRNSTWLDI